MALVISAKVKHKLLVKHGVSEREVRECFCDPDLVLLVDNREDHQTDPPTQWFIGETNMGKRLKVILIFDSGDVIIKSAFPPNAEEERIYSKFAVKSE
jgi:uncharacterized DUF497 family protein